VGIHFSSLKKREGKEAVAEIGSRARELAAASPEGNIAIIGPAESPLARLRGRYRWQLLIRGTESRPLHLLVQELMAEVPRTGLAIRVDVDPVNFM
jgi:primosomal protein N' (replication factor Y)